MEEGEIHVNSIKHKNVLHAAKQSMKREIIDELDGVKHDIACEMSKEVEERDLDLLDSLTQKAHDLTSEYNNFGKSKRAKRKASIQWSDDIQSNLADKPKKPVREVKDWDAVQKIRSEHYNRRPRAGAWLQEGGMVVQRGSKMPMMVLSITSTGNVEVLSAGSTKWVRDISLRPAFDEE